MSQASWVGGLLLLLLLLLLPLLLRLLRLLHPPSLFWLVTQRASAIVDVQSMKKASVTDVLSWHLGWILQCYYYH